MNAPNLKVSVALCTYNGGNSVQTQLQSILRQSRLPDEIIVCDDGSQDDTVETVRRVADQHPCPPIRLTRNAARLGFAKNFESAIRQTTGHIVFLSDQDDLWFSDRIARMTLPFEQEPEVDLVYCDAALADASLKPTGETVFGRRRDMQLPGQRSPRQIGLGVGFNGCMMAFRSTLKDYCLPLCALWGHDHWIAFIAYATTEVRAIPEPLMYYRRHGNNAGLDPDLDGGWLSQYRWLAARRNLKLYAEHSRRWHAMLRALRQIKTRPGCYRDVTRLNEFIEECCHRLQFANERDGLVHRGRLARIPAGVQYLVTGRYRRYARGFRSFAKDMMIQ